MSILQVAFQLLGRESDQAQTLLDLLEESFKAATTSVQSVLTGLAFSYGSSIVLFIFFCFAVKSMTHVYAPNTRNNLPLAVKKRGLHWMSYVWRMDSMRQAENLGLDAVVYLKFVKTLRDLFIILGILAIGIVLPINVSFNLKAHQSPTKSEVLQIMTPLSVDRHPYIGLCVACYLFTALVCFFLWRSHKQLTSVKRKLLFSPKYQKSLFMRTLLIWDIPQSMASDEGLLKIASTISDPQLVQSVSIGRDSKGLDKLLEKHFKFTLKLEKVMAKYARNPDVASKGKKYRVTVEAEDKATFGSHKIDAIDYYVRKLRELEGNIDTIRSHITTAQSRTFGFVSYVSQEHCHRVAQEYSGKKVAIGNGKKCRVGLAPRPENVLWSNIVLSKRARNWKQNWGRFFFTAMMILWIVPNAFIGCFLTQLSRIGILWTAFGNFLDRNSGFKDVLQGILSPIVSSIIFLILPMILRRMSQWQGKITKVEREKSVIRMLYAFFFFNNFLIFSILSVVWNVGKQIATIVSNGEKFDADSLVALNIGSHMTSAIVDVSSFWTVYILKGNIGILLDLLQVFTLIYREYRKRLTIATPRDIIFWSSPQHFDYTSQYNYLLFYCTMSLCFATIQPLVLVIFALYLIPAYFLKKYMLLYMFITKSESDGAYWPLLVNRVLFSLVIGQLALFLVIFSRVGWQTAIAVAPAVVGVIAYKIYINYSLLPRFNYMVPTSEERNLITEECGGDISQSFSSTLENRYQNPVMTRKLEVPLISTKVSHLVDEVTMQFPEYQELSKFDDSGEYRFINDEDMNYNYYKKNINEPLVEDEVLDNVDSSTAVNENVEYLNYNDENKNPGEKPLFSDSESLATFQSHGAYERSRQYSQRVPSNTSQNLRTPPIAAATDGLFAPSAEPLRPYSPYRGHTLQNMPSANSLASTYRSRDGRATPPQSHGIILSSSRMVDDDDEYMGSLLHGARSRQEDLDDGYDDSYSHYEESGDMGDTSHYHATQRK